MKTKYLSVVIAANTLLVSAAVADDAVLEAPPVAEPAPALPSAPVSPSVPVPVSAAVPVSPSVPVPAPRAWPWPVALEFEFFSHGIEARGSGVRRSEFTVSRAELGAGIGLLRHTNAEVRIEAIRSASPLSGFGIDGDSLVLRVKRAHIHSALSLGPVTLHGDAGLIADPWVNGLDESTALRAITASASETYLFGAPGELGFTSAATIGPARLLIAVGNGEGRNFGERNNGKNTTAVLDATLAIGRLRDQPMQLWLAAMARDGSLGPAAARNHRFGGAATLTTAVGALGVEAVRGLGVAGRGDVTATTGAAWLQASIVPRLDIVGRFAQARFALDNSDATGRAQSLMAALSTSFWSARINASNVAGDRASANCNARGLRAWLSVERRTATGIASSLAGTDAQTATIVMLTLSACASVPVAGGTL
ncbi:MAG TPA: hypothetical protein PLF40_06850 [Kofleriaceae bacterium]|nr:hypothetical protein [Kofleriaceae bacterium]